MGEHRGHAQIHLWIQLAEGRARPAEQTQLQARQQSQGQKPVRDLRQKWGWGDRMNRPEPLPFPPKPRLLTSGPLRPFCPRRRAPPTHRGTPVWQVHWVVASGLRRQGPHQPGEQHGLRRPQPPPALCRCDHPARHDQAAKGRACCLGEPREGFLDKGGRPSQGT